MAASALGLGGIKLPEDQKRLEVLNIDTDDDDTSIMKSIIDTNQASITTSRRNPSLQTTCKRDADVHLLTKHSKL